MAASLIITLFGTFTTFSLLVLCLSFFSFADAEGRIGVNLGRKADNLPPPDQVVQLIKAQGLTRVKIFDTDATVLSALANSGISVIVNLPNELLNSTATDQLFVDNWVMANISQFYPSTQIEAIAIGNEVLSYQNITPFLVPAMTNIYNSLIKFNLDSIKISTPISFNVLQSSYPPSSGSFVPELESEIKPMLDLLRKSGSYLMVNVYPFFAYKADSSHVPLSYALFENNSGIVDWGSGLTYYNLLDAQLDAVFAALKALQYDDIRLVVSETGWPSLGDSDEAGASIANAASYNGNLVRKVLTGKGTPLKPNDQLTVYIFALFNEDQKPGPTSERNFGLFYPNGQKVYDIPLALNQSGSGKSNWNTSQLLVSQWIGQTWCIANGKADPKKLQVALAFACGEGGADCGPIQPGGACYDPNTVVVHASYAFNSYYQKKVRGEGSCDFDGTAYVVTQPPRFGNCEYPTGY